jgi:hypothetical protein
VDNILSVASSREENEHFKSLLCSKWTISDLGDVKFALGISIVLNRVDRTVSLNQTALIDRIVTQFRQSVGFVTGLVRVWECHTVPIPANTVPARRQVRCYICTYTVLPVAAVLVGFMV